MNTHNGIIYIGVSNAGEIIRVNNVDETFKAISNINIYSINSSCKEFVKPMAVLEEGKLVN